MESRDILQFHYLPTRALTAALHARDQHTRNHCDRVVDLGLQLASAAGLDDDSAALIEFCARFHDIGKIGIPDSILFKPGRLTAEEWEVMKTHSTIGEQIMRASRLPEADRVARVIRHHHENFGGDGYPDGIEGENIPVESRVILIVDAYDAMRSTRPNRSAMSHDHVMSIMMSEVGWKFDPGIFEPFPVIAEGYTSP